MEEAGALAWARPVPAEERNSGAAAFEVLVDTHYRRTYHFIYRMVGSETDAADLTQETFVRVYRALPRLREDAAAGAWIRRIATNLCLDFLRRRSQGPTVSSIDATTGDPETAAHRQIEDPSARPERLFDSAESLRILHRAVQSLPDDYRTVIVLHHMEDTRVEEIADLLGVPVGTIKSRLSRARRELKRKLLPFFG